MWLCTSRRQAGLELAGAAAGDGAQIGLQVLPAHAHAVVRHRQRPGVLVRDDGDFQVLLLHADGEDYDQYLDTYKLQELIKKYSDYIRYPIVMEVEDYRQKDKPTGR